MAQAITPRLTTQTTGLYHLYLVSLQGTNYKPHLMLGSSSVKNLNRLPYNLNPLSGLLQNNLVEGQEFNSCLPDNELENFSMFSQPTALSLESLMYYLLDFPQETVRLGLLPSD